MNVIKRGRGRPPKNPQPIDGALQQHQYKQDPYQNGGNDNINGQMQQTKEFMCTHCGKTYLSNPALYLHMKIKHVQGEGMPMETLKRGRGRPRKDGQYNNGFGGATGQAGTNRLDPTGDMFLRTENREGGPLDPVLTFEDNVRLLFSDKYQNEGDHHPLWQYLREFSYNYTP